MLLLQTLLEKMNDEELEKALVELRQVNNVEKRIEQLIKHLEAYVEHHSDSEAIKTERIIIISLQTIIGHLRKIEIKIAGNDDVISMVQQEINVLTKLGKYIIDMIKNPEHAQQDATVITHLEALLKKIEAKEMQ